MIHKHDFLMLQTILPLLQIGHFMLDELSVLEERGRSLSLLEERGWSLLVLEERGLSLSVLEEKGRSSSSTQE